MDFFALHFIVFCFSILLLIFFLYRRKLPAGASNSKLPPGKTSIFSAIGEAWDFSTAPEKFLKDRMVKHSSDVFKTCLLGHNIAVLCGPSGNKFLFSNENKYVKSWWPSSVEKVLAHPDIHGHLQERSKQARISMVEFLKPEALRSYIPIMDSFAKQHLGSDNWSPDLHEQVKAFPLVKEYTFSLAANLFMNVRDPMRLKRLADHFSSILAGLISLPVNLPGTAFSRAIESGKLVRGELAEIIRLRKRELQNDRSTTATDVLTRMLLQNDDGDDGGDENDEYEMYLSTILVTLLLTSYDSASIAITFIIYYLADHPHVYRKVIEEQMEVAKSKSPGDLLNWDDIQKMKYSWCVACEAMRLSPPIAGTFREAITDFTYAGFTIPKGWKIYWSAYSSHKNPKYFPNPEDFDPSRFEGNGPTAFIFVPFGGGPRMCVGKEYARLAILVFLHNMVTKFKFKKLIPHERIVYSPNPTPEKGLVLHLEFVDEHSSPNLSQYSIPSCSSNEHVLFVFT